MSAAGTFSLFVMYFVLPQCVLIITRGSHSTFAPTLLVET